MAFGVWAFFLRESDEVRAYNTSTELINYKQSLGIKDKLINLREVNYISGNKEMVIVDDNEYKKTILLYRDICLSDELITTHGSYSFWSYLVMEDYVDGFIESYLPYLNTSNTKSKPRKAINKTADNYTKSLRTLNEKLDELIHYQTIIEGSDTEYQILCNHYTDLYNVYRQSIQCSSDFMLALVEYIDICTFDDNIILDCNYALGDAFARMLKATTTSQVAVEPKYAHDVSVLIETIDSYNDGVNIYSAEYTEYNFLHSYNSLYGSYKDVLNYIFGCNKEIKEQMANGESLSEIITEAQSYAVTILNVIGF